MWFDTRAITNILSLKNVKNKYRVTYDSESEDVFTVHMNKGRVMQLKMHKDGLHYHDTADRQVTLIQTVQQNEASYSQRKLATDRRAIYLYSKVGHPSVQDFKAMIKNNLILNCPVTIDDIERASKIYGANIVALKGKTVRTKSDPVISDYIAVPEDVIRNDRIRFGAYSFALQGCNIGSINFTCAFNVVKCYGAV